jgi:hypothetical protein
MSRSYRKAGLMPLSLAVAQGRIEIVLTDGPRVIVGVNTALAAR